MKLLELWKLLSDWVKSRRSGHLLKNNRGKVFEFSIFAMTNLSLTNIARLLYVEPKDNAEITVYQYQNGYWIFQKDLLLWLLKSSLSIIRNPKKKSWFFILNANLNILDYIAIHFMTTSQSNEKRFTLLQFGRV